MSILKKCKKMYDSIEIPEELEYVVNRAIHQKDIAHKRSNITSFMKGATVALATTFALFIVLLNTNETFAKSMEEIPVINGLAKVFTVREYKEETNTELIEARVPAIQNTGNTELENRINNEISTKINNVLDEAKQRAKEYQEAVVATGGNLDDYRPMLIDVNYEITYQDDNFISFIITKFESLASAYTEQYFYNIDIQTGEELDLRDVLGENYKEIVDKEVTKQIEERKKADENNIYFEKNEGGFSGIENEYQDFYIDENKKVTVVFQKYEIAPGYMGIQNFEIPNDILV